MERLKTKTGFEGLFYVENNGLSGGIVLFWKEEHMAQLISYFITHIDVSVNVSGMLNWRLTRFYGFPERSRRQELWIFFNKSSLNLISRFVMGDFNDLMNQNEKKGRLHHPPSLIQGFNKIVVFTI